MITKDNYFKKVKDIDFKELPEALQEAFITIENNTEQYTTWKHLDKADKGFLKTYFEKLNAFLSKQVDSSTKKKNIKTPTHKEVRSFLEQTSNELHYLYEKPTDQWDEYDLSNWNSLLRQSGKLIENSVVKTVIQKQSEKEFIRKYIELHQRTITLHEINQFLHDLQKAIHENNLLHPKELNNINSQLTKVVKEMQRLKKQKIKIEISSITRKKYQLLLKVKNQAKEKTIKLDGLSGEDISKMHFATMGFKGRWKTLFGDPAKVFHTMIWGGEGSGKSTIGIEFANYLASDLKQAVIYIAGEQRISATLKSIIERIGAKHPNLIFDEELKEDYKKFDFVFIDSVNFLDISYERLVALQEKNPKTCFVYIFQAVKDGATYRGIRKYGHLVDVKIKVESNGETSMASIDDKNRFGGRGSIEVDFGK